MTYHLHFDVKGNIIVEKNHSLTTNLAEAFILTNRYKNTVYFSKITMKE